MTERDSWKQNKVKTFIEVQNCQYVNERVICDLTCVPLNYLEICLAESLVGALVMCDELLRAK